MRLLINLEDKEYNNHQKDVIDPNISFGNISLGNKLWKQAYLLSFCIHNEFMFFNPSFGDVAKYFKYFKHNTIQINPKLFNTYIGREYISNNHYEITRKLKFLLANFKP